MAQFGGDLGPRTENIIKLEPEISYITSNLSIEAIALVTETGYQIAYAALPTYTVDSDALSGDRFRFDNDRENDHNFVVLKILWQKLLFGRIMDTS